MRIPALCGGSFPCCEPEVTGSTAFKVGFVAIGLLFAGSGLAIYLLQVNSIAAFTLMGASGLFFLGSILSCIPRRQSLPISFSPVEPPPLENAYRLPSSHSEEIVQQNRGEVSKIPEGEGEKLKTRAIEEESSDSLSRTSSEEDFLLVPEEKVFLLQIKDRKAQLKRFQALDRTSYDGRADFKSYEIGMPISTCDGFALTGFPSTKDRIVLRDGTKTNGALIWDKLILIGGPRSSSQIEHLWRIAAEMNAAAIVRLGALKGYLEYCPLDSSLEYDQLTINPSEEMNPKTLFDTTTCTQFSVKYDEESRSFPVYAVEGWEDFGTNQYPEIHKLILEIDRLTGPVIIHCRGGFGRTSSLACCWKIYQEFKAAKLEGNPIEIDPVGIVDEMRDVRTALVQNDKQFEMILGYINYLNVFINEE